MAHIDLSRSYAVAELNGSGGIDRRNLSDGKCRIRDIINFRVKSDGSLEKRCGFTALADFPEKIRAEYVLSDELMFVLSGSQIYRVLPKTGAAFLEKNISTSVCGKLFLTDTLKKYPFPVGKLYEDLATVYKIFADSQKIVFSDEKLYHYIQRTGSIRHSKWTNKVYDVMEASENLLNFINKRLDLRQL